MFEGGRRDLGGDNSGKGWGMGGILDGGGGAVREFFFFFLWGLGAGCGGGVITVNPRQHTLNPASGNALFAGSSPLYCNRQRAAGSVHSATQRRLACTFSLFKLCCLMSSDVG